VVVLLILLLVVLGVRDVGGGGRRSGLIIPISFLWMRCCWRCCWGGAVDAASGGVGCV